MVPAVITTHAAEELTPAIVNVKLQTLVGRPELICDTMRLYNTDITIPMRFNTYYEVTLRRRLCSSAFTR